MSTNSPQPPAPDAWQPPHVPAPPAPSGPAAPEPPRKNWFARHKILTGLLALVLFGAIASAVNGGGSTPAATSSPAAGLASAEDAGTAPSEQPKEETKQEAPSEAKMGQKVRDGQFEFTVTKVKSGVKSVGDEYVNQKAQGQYVLVSITVSNIGDKAQMLADSSQKVRDAKGREFSTDTAAAIYIKDNQVFINEINPGNSVKGTLVFDMPKGTAPASIELHDSPFSGGVTVKLS
ncbi:uncharacterized protein DUF4352 [Humibacillus xanthopallidus]|uniref:Uncharacterized protein DUF4352 n=1 Tax=Humibacillus xanthopallidus TaxID=412689 RepID=A0A543PNM3_9MICO|nr:DUF4352 domain-containing protein [Humibacillus xanthopallidus]TQN45685.1 uncharacterized protein DUF4352 [Humibacillus xanthopallidus]